jgi:hypothetical protein
MIRMDQGEGRYRVILIGIGDNTEEKKESFCKNISENYGISFPLLKKIVDRCPIILKKNLSLKNAETLAKTLRSFGAMVSIEKKDDFPVVFLEFQEMVPYQLALESSYLRRTQSGAWNVIGRAKNISNESLNDIWVLVQLFDNLEEFITFEETPIPINPLPPGEASPFKVVFEGDLPILRVSITFKNSSGYPLPTEDRRKKKEWVEVGIKDENGGRPQSIEITEPSERILVEKFSDVQRESIQPSEPEVTPFPPEESWEMEGKGGERDLAEAPLLRFKDVSLEIMSETKEKREDITLRMLDENENQRGEELETLLENEPTQTGSLPVSPSSFDENTQFIEEISGRTGEEEEEEEEEEEKPHPFPWIEDFRNSIGTYYKIKRDIFSIWFETRQKEDGFANHLHSLLTILVHARFDQMSQSGEALENTQKVFKQIVQPKLRLEEIPPLAGTKFFSGENWRDLFHRAFPKLKQVANNILEIKRWNALDLERLIQVIPHMSDKNSRMTVRWINELIPDFVEIDFTNTPISIGESLYRVASRLGVVDPHFDYYQGMNSMGDIKIQSFAQAAFPQYPMKIEEPMTWVGMEEEEGGHCLSIQPRCEGCLFESFCAKLYFDFNPSEKAMRGRW